MTAQNIDSSSRERLGFAEAVTMHITPLLTASGFIRSEATPCAVKFHAPKVNIVVFHDDTISYEIDVAFARQAEPSQRYGLPDMLDAVLGPGHKEQGFFQASEHDRVVACVKTIADLLRKYGGTVLAGDPIMYQRMEEIRRRHSEAYTKQVVQEPSRKVAEDAWKKKDYAKVRNLYNPIEADLTPVEKKRLEYAKAHSPDT